MANPFKDANLKKLKDYLNSGGSAGQPTPPPIPPQPPTSNQIGVSLGKLVGVNATTAMGAASTNLSAQAMTQYYKDMMETERQRVVCRMCGKESGRGNFDSFSFQFGMCRNCTSDIIRKDMEAKIRDAMPKNNKNYCYDCYSHLEACKCPKSEHMRNLKK